MRKSRQADAPPPGKGDVGSRWIWGGGIFLVALAARIGFLLQSQSIPFFSHLYSDSAIYHSLAQSIIRGVAAERAFFMSPLYPYIIAGVQLVFGNELLWVRLLQSVAGSAAILLLYFFARDRFSPAAATVAGLLAALSPFCIYYDNSILLESPLTTFTIFLIILIARAMRSGGVFRWGWAGAVAAILVLLRPGMLLPVLPAVSAGILSGRDRRTSSVLFPFLSFSVAFLLVLSPFALQNLSRENELILVNSSGGFNFYAGNNPLSHGTYVTPDGVDISIDPNGHEMLERRTGIKLSSSDVSSYWYGRAWDWIADNPGAYILLLGRKFLLFWSSDEIDQLGMSIGFVEDQYATLLDLPLPGFILVAALAFAGIVQALRRKAEDPIHAVLLLFLAGYMISVLLFFVTGRFRVPLAPLLFIYAGHACVVVWNAAKRREWRMAGSPVFAAATSLLFMILVPPDFPADYSEEHNRLGMIAFEKQDYDRAQEDFRKALSFRENNRTRLNLANALAVGGELKEADREYQRVIEAEPHNALAYFNFGNFALQVGNPRQAYLLWLRAIKEDSLCAPAYKNIALLLLRSGKYSQALRRFEQYQIFERDPERASGVRREIDYLRKMIREGVIDSTGRKGGS